jgi:hypothetical protein
MRHRWHRSGNFYIGNSTEIRMDGGAVSLSKEAPAGNGGVQDGAQGLRVL